MNLTQELQNDIRGALSRGYCHESTKHLVLKPDLIEAMIKELLKVFHAENDENCEHCKDLPVVR